MIHGPTPTLYADLLVTVDGLAAFHCRRMGLRLVPAFPLESRQSLLRRCGVARPGAGTQRAHARPCLRPALHRRVCVGQAVGRLRRALCALRRAGTLPAPAGTALSLHDAHHRHRRAQRRARERRHAGGRVSDPARRLVFQRERQSHHALCRAAGGGAPALRVVRLLQGVGAAQRRRNSTSATWTARRRSTARSSRKMACCARRSAIPASAGWAR